MHALIIEDQPLFGELIEEELRDLGYDTAVIVASEADRRPG